MRLQILTLFLSLATSSACAETHDIKMLNRNETGPMVYEPDFVQIAPGDTVKFIAAASGHNAATIDGMVPDGHPGFKGKINEEIEVILGQEGFYGIKCSPHVGMGMVMVIRVGDAALEASFLNVDVPPRAHKRFDEILARNGFGK
ncbi:MULTISPECIES: pseudoazurin [unclassified Mesorhizobium]|uniref:pseudoazurin n=1 Tax=unclassified Mesorhizobium TaxID=325217 RepID=UPI000FE8C409|nr:MULTISPECIES: pseudoazurin [unclassified Mesorhizobium]RWB98681.1 MAG: pseudoazurin [Mesorhizobium sp.]TGV21937.1 pseudoazurin [Mesorhizobium sp. M4B.F.Ca.ET.143.01.1.1]